VILEQREITIEWVVRVITQPALVLQDTADPGLLHAYGPVPERGGRVLRVVYNPGADTDLVVTVFFDRSMKGKL